METVKRPTFQQTVDVLVKAYLNDTLVHGNCCACAVGNLIAHAHNWRLVPKPEGGICVLRWDSGVMFNWFVPLKDGNRVQITSQTKPTGYTADELGRIEHAFESVDSSDATRERDEMMFLSLMAVVNVLAEIHNIDLSVREEAKALFVKA